jgi:hypothetical protein
MLVKQSNILAKLLVCLTATLNLTCGPREENLRKLGEEETAGGLEFNLLYIRSPFIEKNLYHFSARSLLFLHPSFLSHLMTFVLAFGWFQHIFAFFLKFVLSFDFFCFERLEKCYLLKR